MYWYAAGLFTMIGRGGVEVVIWTPFSPIWTSSRRRASRCRTRWTGREAPRGISTHAPHMWKCGDMRAGHPGTAVRPGAPGTCAGRRRDDDSKPLQNTYPAPPSAAVGRLLVGPPERHGRVRKCRSHCRGRFRKPGSDAWLRARCRRRAESTLWAVEPPPAHSPAEPLSGPVCGP